MTRCTEDGTGTGTHGVLDEFGFCDDCGDRVDEHVQQMIDLASRKLLVRLLRKIIADDGGYVSLDSGYLTIDGGLVLEASEQTLARKLAESEL